MTTLRRTAAATLTALVLFVGVPVTPAAAQADTTAVAINTRDGGSVFRLAFSVRRVMDETVDQSNAAVAFASCSDCQTVAISFQIVLVMSDPDVVIPENLAISINYDCTSCTTFTDATQFVLGTDGIVRLSADGQRRLNEARLQLLALRDQELTQTEFDAAVDKVRTEVASILSTELVLVKPEEDTTQRTAGTQSTSSTSSTTTPSSTSTTAPTTTSTTASTTTTSTSTTTTTTGP